MKREIQTELLDHLPPDDPGAMGSRRDLQRLNAWMGNCRIMAQALRSVVGQSSIKRIVEIGAGDGTLMHYLALRLSREWPEMAVVLVDQQSVVADELSRGIASRGWQVEVVKADVFEWSSRACAVDPAEAVIANLFVHHFDNAHLAQLFQKIAARARLFVAVEPRRSTWAYACSRQLWLLGHNRVTQHDAPISVRAGFREKELSQLWPSDRTWALREHQAGWFSHLFVAQRTAQ